MKPLLNRVVSKPNESLYSLLYRTAIENYYDHLGSMLKNIAPHIYVLNCNYLDDELVMTQTLKEVVTMLNLDVNEYTLNRFDNLLIDFIEPSSRKKMAFQSHRVYQKYGTKYCPLCIQEDYYHQLNWDVSLLTMCQKHGVCLIDKCPNCRNKILLGRFMKNECHCGFRYSETGEHVKETNQMVLEAQKTIYNFLQMQTRQNFKGMKINNTDYFYFLFHICFFRDGQDVKRVDFFNDCSIKKINFLKYTKDKRDVEMMRLVTTVAHHLVVYPQKYLSRILGVIDELRGVSLESYVSRCKYLKKILEHERGGLYQETYSNYLNELKDEYINERTLIKMRVQKKKYVTQLEAMRIINTEIATVNNLCNYGLIALHQTKNRGRIIKLIERESIERYLNMKKESMTLSQFCSYVGLSFRKAIDLVEKGYVEPLHGPKKDGYPIWYFNREEVEVFLSRFLAKAVSVNNISNVEWIPFRKANTKLRIYNVDTIMLIELLLKGVFRFIVPEGEKRIREVLVNVEDINEYIKTQKKKHIKRYGLRIKQLQDVFKVGEPKLRNWIQDGILCATYEEGTRCGNISQYVSLEEVKKSLMLTKGWSEKTANRHIEKCISYILR